MVTGVSAFSLSLMAMGATFYHNVYENRPMPFLPDPENCLPVGFNKYKTNALVRNHFRYARAAAAAPLVCCAFVTRHLSYGHLASRALREKHKVAGWCMQTTGKCSCGGYRSL
jgi:hypothetical protein